MTIKRVLRIVDNICPCCAIPERYKIRLLSDLERKILNKDLHCEQNVGDPLYDEDTDQDTELVVKFPFDDIYVKYLCAKIAEERWMETFFEYQNYCEKKQKKEDDNA